MVGIPFLTVMGLAAAGTVAAAVLIAHTLLPALLGFAGRKVIGTRIPGVRRPDYDDSAPDAKTSFGERWARLVTRRRGPVLIAGVALSRWLAGVLPNVDIEGQSLLDRRPMSWTRARPTACPCRSRRERGAGLLPAPSHGYRRHHVSYCPRGAPMYTVPVQTGKRFVITGANSGTGKEATRRIAAAGGAVIMARRRLLPREARSVLGSELNGGCANVLF